MPPASSSGSTHARQSMQPYNAASATATLCASLTYWHSSQLQSFWRSVCIRCMHGLCVYMGAARALHGARVYTGGTRPVYTRTPCTPRVWHPCIARVCTVYTDPKNPDETTIQLGAGNCLGHHSTPCAPYNVYLRALALRTNGMANEGCTHAPPCKDKPGCKVVQVPLGKADGYCKQLLTCTMYVLAIQ